MLTIKPGQSLLDIALQTKGDVSRVVEIADQNGVSVTDSLQAGTELVVEYDLTKPSVRDYKEQGIFPGTLAELGEGIGYWGIGMDFIIH